MKHPTQLVTTAAQVGWLILSVRKSRKLTQAQLGARLGLSQRRISELEHAPGTLSMDQFLALCSHLGLQLNVQPRDDESHTGASSGVDW